MEPSGSQPQSPMPTVDAATQTGSPGNMESQPTNSGLEGVRPHTGSENVHYHYHFHFSNFEQEESAQQQQQQQQLVPAAAAQAVQATTPNAWAVGNVLWPSPALDTPVRRGRGRPSNAERQLRAQVTALLHERRGAHQWSPPAPVPGTPGVGVGQMLTQLQQPFNLQPLPAQQQPAIQQQPQPPLPQPAQQPYNHQPLQNHQQHPFSQPQPVAGGATVAAAGPPVDPTECVICRQPNADSRIRRCRHNACFECMRRWLLRRRVCPDSRCVNECTIADVEPR